MILSKNASILCNMLDSFRTWLIFYQGYEIQKTVFFSTRRLNFRMGIYFQEIQKID